MRINQFFSGSGRTARKEWVQHPERRPRTIYHHCGIKVGYGFAMFEARKYSKEGNVREPGRSMLVRINKINNSGGRSCVEIEALWEVGDGEFGGQEVKLVLKHSTTLRFHPRPQKTVSVRLNGVDSKIGVAFLAIGCSSEGHVVPIEPGNNYNGLKLWDDFDRLRACSVDVFG